MFHTSHTHARAGIWQWRCDWRDGEFVRCCTMRSKNTALRTRPPGIHDGVGVADVVDLVDATRTEWLMWGVLDGIARICMPNGLNGQRNTGTTTTTMVNTSSLDPFRDGRRMGCRWPATCVCVDVNVFLGTTSWYWKCFRNWSRNQFGNWEFTMLKSVKPRTHDQSSKLTGIWMPRILRKPPMKAGTMWSLNVVNELRVYELNWNRLVNKVKGSKFGK